MSEERFIVEKSKGTAGTCKVIVDKETGVNYLFYRDNATGTAGLTLLVGVDGKPVVTPVI